MAGTGLEKYLGDALSFVERLGLGKKEGEETQMAKILTELAPINNEKVLGISRVFQYMGTFNELVRNNVEDIKVGDRYGEITKNFDSVRDDAKTLVKQLDDGKIDFREKASNLWMRMVRGSPIDRFGKIKKLYEGVSQDTKSQLEKEQAIMDAYINFRFAVKEAEILSHEVLQIQEKNLQVAKEAFGKAVDSVKGYTGTDNADKSRLELARDQAQVVFNQEDRKYQLIKDVAENLTIGYNVGETLVGKLQQTHNVKDQVYRRAVTFFSTNEHVFTTLAAVYTSELGLHESTQTINAMTEGVNKGLEDVAELGTNLERAALKAGYGSTLRPESVKKLVDAIVSFQEESTGLITQLRDEATKNSAEIRRIVDDGKERYRAAIENYAKADTKALPSA